MRRLRCRCAGYWVLVIYCMTSKKESKDQESTVRQALSADKGFFVTMFASHAFLYVG